MRDQINRSVESLHRKLAGFEQRLRNLKRTIEAAETSRGAIGREIAAAEVALRRIEDDAQAARARMQLQAEERALAANGQVEEWKQDREMEKLRSRAEDAEACAAWSLIVATRVIDEAELATLRAIAARMDFENGSAEQVTDSGPQ